VSSFSSSRIVAYDTSGNYISTFGTNGSGNGQLSVPRGLDVNSSGQIWVADTGNDRVSLFDSSGTWVRNVGSPGSANGQFDQPHDVVEDGSGDIYVTDSGNRRIQKFHPALAPTNPASWGHLKNLYR
jgi:DNA-binding beta-propeller fold protein YncE